MLIQKTSSFGPFVDGRRVTAWSYPGLPGWAWESLLVQGEPGAGVYMTLPRSAFKDHPWLGEHKHYAGHWSKLRMT
jgi:hypothetical protein